MHITTLLAVAGASAATLMVTQPDTLSQLYGAPAFMARSSSVAVKTARIPFAEPDPLVLMSPVSPFDDFVVHIPLNYGQWDVKGFIGDVPVSFMVDTGSFYVTLTQKTAATMGGLRKIDSKAVIMANGDRIVGERVSIPAIRIGMIELRDVTGLVIPTKDGASNLLGSTFLNRLHWTHDPQGGGIKIWE